MKIVLDESFKGNHAKGGSIVDLPKAIAEAGIKKGIFKKVPSKKK